MGRSVESANRRCDPAFSNTKFRSWEDHPNDPVIKPAAAQEYVHIAARRPAPGEASIVPFTPAHPDLN